MAERLPMLYSRLQKLAVKNTYNRIHVERVLVARVSADCRLVPTARPGGMQDMIVLDNTNNDGQGSSCTWMSDWQALPPEFKHRKEPGVKALPRPEVRRPLVGESTAFTWAIDRLLLARS